MFSSHLESFRIFSFDQAAEIVEHLIITYLFCIENEYAVVCSQVKNLV